MSSKKISNANQTEEIYFPDWINSFKKSRAGANAITELNKLKRTSDDSREFEALETYVLHHCYVAQKYNEKTVKAFMISARRYKTKAIKQAKSVKALQAFLEEYPGECSLALFSDCEPKLNIYRSEFSNILESFSKNIQNIDVFHPRHLGPLYFPKPIDPNNYTSLPALAKHGLFFRLVVLFRYWTEYGQALTLTTGQKMPKYGRPYYKLVSLFVDATLDTNLSQQDTPQNSFKSLLKSNPGLAIGNF